VSFEAYIIDNNSKGDGFDKVVSKYQGNNRLNWIKNSENMGGIAANRIFPKLKGRYVMLLGNDTITLPGCFRNLVDFMNGHQDAGAVSAKLLNPDGSVQSYYARFHDLPMFFWRATLIGSAIDRLIFQGKHARYYWYSELDHEKLNIVDQPPAPCLLIRRADFTRDYFIDEQISLFFGDVDLCRRIYNSGYKIYVLPTAQIIHFPGSSFKKADPKWAEAEYRKSLLLYFKKYFPHQIPLLQFLLFADSLPQFIYKKLHDRTINLLRKELVDCESILDLGCGANSPVQYINAAYTLGVDNDQESLEESDKNTIHTEYLKADIMKLEYGEKSFDAVLILDVLQYLDKGEGQAIISRAQIWAKKRLIVTVPNNYRYADEVKSVWRVRDLTKLRLKVYGLAGLRVLHGRWGSIKYIPRVFWKAVSFASQPIIYRLPQLAFLLGAVYRAGRNNDGR
jgi:hypothetical protein